MILPVLFLCNPILQSNEIEISRTNLSPYKTSARIRLHPCSRPIRRQDASFHNQHPTKTAIPIALIASNAAQQSPPDARNSLNVYRAVHLSPLTGRASHLHTAVWFPASGSASPSAFSL